jgi:hypothetical protein
MALTHQQFEAYAERLKIEPDKAVREIILEIIVESYRELASLRQHIYPPTRTNEEIIHSYRTDFNRTHAEAHRR